MSQLGQDCFFFYNSKCMNGSACPFRHQQAAFGREEVCGAWLSGTCFNPYCSNRHPSIQKSSLLVPCFWETQPSGCRKPSCTYRHSQPRAKIAADFAKESSGSILPPVDPVDWAMLKVQTTGHAGKDSLIDVPIKVEQIVINPREEESDQDSVNGSPLKISLPVTTSPIKHRTTLATITTTIKEEPADVVKTSPIKPRTTLISRTTTMKDEPAAVVVKKPAIVQKPVVETVVVLTVKSSSSSINVTDADSGAAKPIEDIGIKSLEQIQRERAIESMRQHALKKANAAKDAELHSDVQTTSRPLSATSEDFKPSIIVEPVCSPRRDNDPRAVHLKSSTEELGSTALSRRIVISKDPSRVVKSERPALILSSIRGHCDRHSSESTSVDQSSDDSVDSSSDITAPERIRKKSADQMTRTLEAHKRQSKHKSSSPEHKSGRSVKGTQQPLETVRTSAKSRLGRISPIKRIDDKRNEDSCSSSHVIDMKPVTRKTVIQVTRNLAKSGSECRKRHSSTSSSEDEFEKLRRRVLSSGDARDATKTIIIKRHIKAPDVAMVLEKVATKDQDQSAASASSSTTSAIIVSPDDATDVEATKKVQKATEIDLKASSSASSIEKRPVENTSITRRIFVTEDDDSKALKDKSEDPSTTQTKNNTGRRVLSANVLRLRMERAAALERAKSSATPVVTDSSPPQTPEIVIRSLEDIKREKEQLKLTQLDSNGSKEQKRKRAIEVYRPPARVASRGEVLQENAERVELQRVKTQPAVETVRMERRNLRKSVEQQKTLDIKKQKREEPVEITDDKQKTNWLTVKTYSEIMAEKRAKLLKNDPPAVENSSRPIQHTLSSSSLNDKLQDEQRPQRISFAPIIFDSGSASKRTTDGKAVAVGSWSRLAAETTRSSSSMQKRSGSPQTYTSEQPPGSMLVHNLDKHAADSCLIVDTASSAGKTNEPNKRRRLSSSVDLKNPRNVNEKYETENVSQSDEILLSGNILHSTTSTLNSVDKPASDSSSQRLSRRSIDGRRMSTNLLGDSQASDKNTAERLETNTTSSADINLDCDDIFSDSFLHDLVPLSTSTQGFTGSAANLILDGDDDFLMEMKELLS